MPFLKLSVFLMQIRACDLSTSWENILTWNRTLNVFDLLGMNVGSLQK